MDILKKRENKEDDPNETNFLPVYIYNKEIRGGCGGYMKGECYNFFFLKQKRRKKRRHPKPLMTFFR